MSSVLYEPKPSLWSWCFWSYRKCCAVKCIYLHVFEGKIYSMSTPPPPPNIVHMKYKYEITKRLYNYMFKLNLSAAVTTLCYTVSSTVRWLPTFELFSFCFLANYKLWLSAVSFSYLYRLFSIMILRYIIFFLYIDFCHLCFCNMWRILWSSPG